MSELKDREVIAFMKDSNLLLLALVVGLLGVVTLYFLSANSTLLLSNFSSVRSMDGFEEVRVEGRVEKVTTVGNITLVTLSSKELLQVVVYDKVSLTRGGWIEVTGVVDDYKGEKQMVAESIKG